MWHDPDDRLGKAVERFEEGAIEAARLMLRNLDRQGVMSPRIDLYLGHCHLEEGQYAAAMRRYRRAISQAPDSPAAWMGLGLCFGRMGDLDRAIEAFLEAEQREPELEEVQCNLAHCYALAGDLERTEHHARRATELDASCPHPYRHLALAYLVADQPERSLDAWRRVLAIEPEHPEADVGRGRAYAALGRRREASRAYLRALNGPFAADAAFGLGDLSRSRLAAEDAAGHYRQAVELDGEFVEARLRWAECLCDAARFEEADRALQGLADDELGSGEPLSLRARILRGLGKPLAAMRLLRAAVKGEPGPAEGWRRLGEFLLDLGRLRPAERALRRALDLDPDEVAAVRALARVSGRRGHVRQATHLLSRAAHRNPLVTELHLDLAAAHVAAGREGPAERALLRGLSWLPDDPDLWAGAAEIALDRGDLGLARSRLRSALRRHRRHGHALYLLQRWLLETRQFSRAVRAGEVALRILPGGHLAVREHGRALLECGRAGAALVPLRRYVLAEPSDPAGYELLARTLDRLGDAQGARTQRRLSGVAAGVS